MLSRNTIVGVAALLCLSACYETNPDYVADDVISTGNTQPTDESTASTSEGMTMGSSTMVGDSGDGDIGDGDSGNGDSGDGDGGNGDGGDGDGGDGDGGDGDGGWTDSGWNDSGSEQGDGDGDMTTSSDGDGDDDGCPMGEDLCDGECVDLQDNEQHCGMCDNPCPGGPNMCVDGACSGG